MTIAEQWAALGRAQKLGFVVGAMLIVLATAGVAVWVLRDPWTPIATNLTADRVVALQRELAREKLEYRVAEDGGTVEVRQSSAGRARAVAATGGVGLPPNVGLEIFKDTDFSTTDFAQRINYQRALQGEITRTLQTIHGVRQARVHVVLPEGSVLKRDAAKASAAVTLTLAPGRTLGRTQVRGVQRLVAASVPAIKPDDVVVLDETGASLVRDASTAEADLSTSQLDLKRQVDGYLEAKLTRLLEELAPGTQASLSVDTVLDYKQMRVTVEEPIVAAVTKGAGRATGVVTKERQLQRMAGGVPVDAPEAESTDLEIEYKVGHRVEQSMLAPGTIRRVSVAVALHGAPAELTERSVESLVAHAVGIDRQRGDSVMVVMLGGAAAAAAADAAAAPATPATDKPTVSRPALAGVSYMGLAAGLALFVAIGLAGLRRERAQRVRLAKLTQTADDIRKWLAEDLAHGRH